MSRTPARASHPLVFITAYLAVFLALTVAPTVWRIAQTGASAGFNGPILTVLLTFGSLIAAAAGAGVVFRLGRWRLSAWNAVRPRETLLVGALAGAMSAAVTDAWVQVALFNGLAVVLRTIGLDPFSSGVGRYPASGLALSVKIGVSLLTLFFCCGVAASVLVYFASLAQLTGAHRLEALGEGLSS